MGPIVLFDKSFLQSLSIDESVWFDNFFMTVICPIFYVETLADLHKKVRDGRTSEQEVRIIADKTPECHTYPNTFHQTICTGDLLGYQIIMDGRPALAGGKHVKVEDKRGVVFEPSPEVEAFSRWQKEDFQELEKRYAKNWRSNIENLDFESVTDWLRSLGMIPNKCKTLQEAKEYAELIVNDRSNPMERTKFVVSLLGIKSKYFLPIYYQWGNAGFPPLSIHAPYAAHVLTVELFFYIAISSNLISSERKSNKVDMAYLFYLPFCMAFISSDKLHLRCAPLFLNTKLINNVKQKFIWGPDLKSDLKKIDQYYDKLQESYKEKGLHAFATSPPNGDFLVTEMHDHFFPHRPKTTNKEIQIKDIPQKSTDHILKDMKNYTKAKALKINEVDFDLSDADSVIFKRKIRKKKGKWWQIDKSIKDNHE